MVSPHEWHDFVDHDLETHPDDRVPIEAEFENGRRAQATFQRGGGLSLLNASSEITDGTTLKRWRYLKRPSGHEWHDFVDDDLETHPDDRVPIEAEFENGRRAQATFQRGGGLSLLNASSEITGGTTLKRWRYLRRP